MTRVAAIGDIHVGADPVGHVAAGLTDLSGSVVLHRHGHQV